MSPDFGKGKNGVETAIVQHISDDVTNNEHFSE